MFSNLNSSETYLFLSFLITIVGLYALGHKKVSPTVSQGIETIRTQISDSRQQKTQLQQDLIRLSSQLQAAEKEYETTRARVLSEMDELNQQYAQQHQQDIEHLNNHYLKLQKKYEQCNAMRIKNMISEKVLSDLKKNIGDSFGFDQALKILKNSL